MLPGDLIGWAKIDALQNHVTVQSSATGAGGASLVLVGPGTSQGSIRDRWHTHVSVGSTSTQQEGMPRFQHPNQGKCVLCCKCTCPNVTRVFYAW
ncbi:hypothetical protein HaLaN_13450, partial [Haematococcus lacustris]